MKLPRPNQTNRKPNPLKSEIREILAESLRSLDKRQKAVDAEQALITPEWNEAVAMWTSLKLGDLPIDPSGPKAPVPGKQDSISSLIVSAIRANPGLAASGVVSAVKAVRRDVSGKVIHAILYRLRVVEKKIRNEGDRGDMRYFLAETGSTRERKPRESKTTKRTSKPYKAMVHKFINDTPGQHTVAEIAKMIGRPASQARSILVRLFNAGLIARVSEGVYERNQAEGEALMPGG